MEKPSSLVLKLHSVYIHVLAGLNFKEVAPYMATNSGYKESYSRLSLQLFY